MRTLGCLLTLALCVPVVGQERPLPPPKRVPVLRLSQEHAALPVTALAFTADGTTLLVGGYDKIVRSYSVETGDAGPPLRLPVGPGNAGAVNAVAVSPDGKWVAVAGRGPMRGEARVGEDGVVTDTRQISGAMRRDLGVIYLFDRANPNRGAVLRGHEGEVRTLTFADPSPVDGPLLISAATERDTAGGETGVLRAWDVATAKEVAVKQGLPATATRPGLAAWATGGGRKGATVAVAWREIDENTPGELRIWQTDTNAIIGNPDGIQNLALTVLRNQQGTPTEVVSGSYSRGGRLMAWPLGAGAARTIPFPSAGGVAYLPVAVVATGDSLVTLLSTTAKSERPGQQVAELRLLGPDGATVRTVPLTGVSAANLPVMAASRDGKLVAVGGFTDHRVEVFEVAALAAGRETRKVLGGSTGGFAAVSFLDGNRLWVGEADQAPAKGGTVFDFTARKSAPNDGQAKPDAPAEVARIEFTGRDPEVVVIVNGNRIVCKLRPAERPTAAAYLPAAPAWGKERGAVVAIAHTEPENATTLVTLFDGATGRRLRQLVGPELPVRKLAFSAARPLLAAVCGDRTVCVWSLADLDKQVGGIEGLRVTDNGGEVRVLAVAEDAAAETRSLAPNDVIEGFAAADGKTDPVKTAVEFVWSVRSRRVGGTASVRVKGKAVPIVLPVGRAVEQRGPLFTLWLSPFGKAENPDWVGFSPNGPYDASSPAAESRIGWLTATGDPEHPTAFDGADQHRKTYYRKDMLRFLFEKGELSSALQAHTDEYAPPPARLTLSVVGPTQPVGPDAPLRDPRASLRVTLDDVTEDYPLVLAVLRWRVTAPGEQPGAWTDVRLAGLDRSFSIDLSRHGWARGYHTIEATLHRTATSPVGARATAEVPFAPPAPRLTILANGKAVADGTVKTEVDALPIAAQVELLGGEADVTLAWADPTGGRGSVALVPKAGGEFAPRELKLKPGRTSVRVTATTKGAGQFTKFETQEVDLAVDFTPPKVFVGPRLSRLNTTPASEPSLVGGKPILIASEAKVRLAAAVESADPLTVVEWDEGDGQWQTAELAKRVVTREVTLKPGAVRTVRVRAKTEKSEFATAVADVVYYPVLPVLRIDRLPAETTNPMLAVEGTCPTGGLPYRAAVVVMSADGRTRPFDVAIDGGAGTWKAAVVLEPGENRLSLTLRNDWRTETRRGLATVSLRRPPRVVHVHPVDAGENGVADVVALVATADGAEPGALIVNGQPVATKPPRKVSPLPGIVWYELTAPAVPVAGAGKPDAATVTVRTGDGDSAPVTVAVKRKVVPLKPPVIALADGPQDRTTDQPLTTIAFKVSSQTPLSRVEVWHAGRSGVEFERVAAVDPKAAAAVADGFTLTGRADVALRTGVNLVRVVAVNAGGEAQANVAVSYTSPGALLTVDGVDELGVNGTTRPLTAKGRAYEESVGGLVVVRGRVTWPADDDTARTVGLHAIVFANGIGHQPVKLEPVKEGGAVYTFRAPVFLNAPDSILRVELRATGREGTLPQQAAGARVFQVRCKAPITQQRLHVVVIGVDVPPAERFALAKTVIASIGGRVPPDRESQFDRGEFQVGTFSQAILYPPVVGEVNDGSVAWALDEVSREVTRLSSGKDKWLNDMVLVLYQGKDWTAPDGKRYLHTSRSLRYPETVADRFAMRFDGLPVTPGVRLAILNVANAGQALDPLTGGPPLLRYGWRDLAATDRLFPVLEKAIASRRALGDIVAEVRKEVVSDPNLAGAPLERIPTELLDRPIGSGSK